MAPPSVAVVNLKEFGSLDGSTQRRRAEELCGLTGDWLCFQFAINVFHFDWPKKLPDNVKRLSN